MNEQNQSLGSNDSNIDSGNGRLFLGRQEFSAWVQETITHRNESRVMLIHGEQQIGKSALLQHLSTQHVNEETKSVYIDCQAITTTSLSQFFHAFARDILKSFSIDETLQQSDFVANPFTRFGDLLIQIEKNLNNNKLLFFIDNFDAVWNELADDDEPHTFLENFDQQISKTEDCWFIMSAQSLNHWIDESEVSFQIKELTPLTEKESILFIDTPLRMTIVDDVSQFFHSITQGKPTILYPLSKKLSAEHDTKENSQITKADIIKAALELDILKPSEVANHHPENFVSQVTKYQSYSPTQMGVLFLIVLLIPFSIFISNRRAQAQIANPPAEEVVFESLSASNEESSNVIESDNTPTSEPQPTEVPTEVPPTIEPSSTPLPTSTGTPTVTPIPTATPTPTPTPLFYPEELIRDSDNMSMVLIPSGTFVMGSADGEFLSNSDEYPQREVFIDQFYIDQFEISVEQYASFLNRLGNFDNACDFFDCALPRFIAGYTSYLTLQDLGDGAPQYTALPGFATYPMNHVSWYGANNYCQAMGARLPTEAEWEYAARGIDGRLYPWGNEPPDETLATFNSDSYDNLKPVDALPDGASPFGIFNMSGSLWEWTADWYDESYYETAPNENPLGPETGLTKVIRGGGWPYNNQAERIRAANRNQLTPDFISSTVGFRCARTP